MNGWSQLAVGLSIFTLLFSVLVYDAHVVWQDEAQIVGWGREILGYDVNRASLSPETNEQYVLFAPVSEVALAWADENLGKLRHRVLTIFFAFGSGVALYLLLVSLDLSRGISVIAGAGLFMDPMYLLSWSGGRADSLAFFFCILGAASLSMGFSKTLHVRWYLWGGALVFFILGCLCWITAAVLVFELVALVLALRVEWSFQLLTQHKFVFLGVASLIVGLIALLLSQGDLVDTLMIVLNNPGTVEDLIAAFNWNYPLLLLCVLLLMLGARKILLLPVVALVISLGVFTLTDVYVFRAVYTVPLMYALIAIAGEVDGGKWIRVQQYGLKGLVLLNFLVAGYAMPGMRLRDMAFNRPDRIIDELRQFPWGEGSHVYCEPWEVVMLGYGDFIPVRHFRSFELERAMQLVDSYDWLVISAGSQHAEKFREATVICQNCGNYGPYLVVESNRLSSLN